MGDIYVYTHFSQDFYNIFENLDFINMKEGKFIQNV